MSDPNPDTSGRKRLVDYFVIAGYDRHHSGRRIPGRRDMENRMICNGAILQRFPTKDWRDAPFIGEKVQNQTIDARSTFIFFQRVSSRFVNPTDGS